MRKSIIAFAAAALLVGCTGGKETKIVGNLKGFEAPDTLYLYLLGQQEPEKIPVVNGKFTYKVPTDIRQGGFIGNPGDYTMMALFVPEGGTMKVSFTKDGDLQIKSNKKSSLTGALENFYEAYDKIAQEYSALADSLFKAGVITEANRDEKLSEMDSHYMEEVEELCTKTAKDNLDNYVGLNAVESFANAAGVSKAAALVRMLDPSLWENEGAAELKNMVDALQATAEGKDFVDFTITQPDGTDVSLSDFVGNGKCVLVDFWASWCAPCVEEFPFLKTAYREFSPDKFEILGIAVWDEPEDSRKAITEEGLPWKQILGAQTEPSQLYGIEAIPHMILFSPEGKIIRRGFSGEEILDILDKYVK